MERYKRFIERLYDDHITNNYDRIIPVLGDEGVGKSTWILQAMWLYDQHRGRDPSPERILNYVIFDSRDAFRDRLINANTGDPLAAMDAAHVLYRKETMNPEQMETEKSLLDIRVENYFILLGYQDWSDIPDQLQRRRAKNLIRIPKRGVVYGYNRAQLDEKYSKLGKNEWPEPALKDTFPSLEGTELWNRFEQIDAERKRERLLSNEEDSDELTPQDVAAEILAGDVAEYVEHNEFQDRTYFSKPMIRFDYPELSDQQTDQVRAKLRREVDVTQYAPEGTDTQPPTPEG